MLNFLSDMGGMSGSILSIISAALFAIQSMQNNMVTVRKAFRILKLQEAPAVGEQNVRMNKDILQTVKPYFETRKFAGSLKFLFASFIPKRCKVKMKD